MEFFLNVLTIQLSNEASNTNKSEDTYTWTNVEMEQHIWEIF